MKDIDLSLDYKIKDMALAEEGHKDMQLSEKEIPGLNALRIKYGTEKPLKSLKIMGSIHMTFKAALLIDTLYDLGANVRWYSCKILTTHDHAAAVITDNNSAKVFA